MSTFKYKQVGDYKYPDVKIPDEDLEWGRFGDMRNRYITEHQYPLMVELFKAGTLRKHLYEVDQTAQTALQELIKEMAEAEGIDNELMNNDQMTWVQAMNNIRQRAEEIVIQQYIYPEESTY